MKRTVAAICITCFIAVLLCPFHAFAYDAQYVNELEKWSANESVEWFELSGENATGYMQCFYGDNCVYFHFFVQSREFTENDDSLYVTADVKNMNRAYSLSFSAESDDSDLPCKIYKNFGTSPAGLRNILFAFEFNNKVDKNYKNIIDISVCTGGSRLAEVDNLNFGSDPEPKTTKSATTKASTTRQTTVKTKETTAKSSKTATQKSANAAAAKSDTQKTTKFKYVEDAETAAENETSQSDTAAQAEIGGENGTESSTENGSLSSTAKALIAAAAGTAAFGTAFLIKGISAKKAENLSEKSNSDLNSQNQSGGKE